MLVNMFDEYVRVSALNENAVIKEFDTAKRHVLRVLKAYAYGEMKEEMDKRNPNPKEIKRTPSKNEDQKKDQVQHQVGIS